MKNYLMLFTLLLFFTACNETQNQDAQNDDIVEDSIEDSKGGSTTDEEVPEVKEELKYRKYELNQEDNDLSYKYSDKVLDAVPLIEGDFVFFRTFVSPTSDVEIYSNQEALKGVRLPNDFFDLQDLVIKEYDNDVLSETFGPKTTLKTKRANALKGGDKFETNVDYNIDLYAKMKMSSGDVLYLGTLNEYTKKGLYKRGWHLFYMNEGQQIVSASSFFFSLYYSEGQLAATYFYASNQVPEYFLFDMEDEYIQHVQPKDDPEVVKELDAAMKGK